MQPKRSLEWLKRHRKRLAVWCTGIFVAVILFSVSILPTIIRYQAENGIKKATGRTARIESISFNPFGMTLTIKGFSILEQNNTTPFVQLGSLRVSLSSATLFKFVPVIDELRIDRLDLKLVRTAANRYNFSDILEHVAKQPKKETTAPPGFSVNNIVMQGSNIDFDDQAVAGGKKHTVRDISLAIPFISNIPHLAEKYTDPTFTATVNGARVSFAGKAKPLAKAVEADLELKLTDLDLPHYLAYLPVQVPVKLTNGKLTLDLSIIYRIYQNKKPELLIQGLTRLDTIQIKDTSNNAPLASFKRFDIVLRDSDLFSKRIALRDVLLDGLTLYAERDHDGKLNFQRLMPAPAPKPKKAVTSPAKKAQAALQLVVDNLALTDGSLQFQDAQPAGGFKTRLSGINLTLANFSTVANTEAAYQFSLNGDQQETVAIEGTAVLAPFTATARYKLAQLNLQRGWPYLQNLLAAPVKGVLSLDGKAAFSESEGVSVTDLTLNLKNLAAEYGNKDGARLSSLDISGVEFSQKENTASVNEIRLGKGTIQISKEADGTLSALSLLKTTSPAAAPAPKAPKKSGTKPLTWQIKKIIVAGLGTTFIDKSFSDPPRFTLSNSHISIGNLTGPKFSVMPVNFSSTYGNNAPLKLAGDLLPQPFRFHGSVSFKKLPIEDFEPYFPENLNLYILGGTLDNNMKLDLAIDSTGKPTGSFSGSTGLRGFHAIDAVQEEDLLKWESLQLDQISGNLAPFSLAIRQIALNGVYSRIAVRKDGSLNLQNLVGKEQQKAADKSRRPEKQVAAATTATMAAAPKPQIRVDALTIQDGTMDFSDAHLPQPFRTTFHNLGGRVSGLSSEMNSRAEVDLRGNLENYSPLQLTGTINPLREDLFVDLTISFKDIELAPATPYSGTYLGYRIDKGKLFLDLKYHIENKQLQASNKVFVDQFTFGDAVASDKATKLPVRLGVALLKDRNGQIHLDLPVSGRTDDPKFSIWGVVWQVVANLFIKAATSPFALLSSMMGSSEDLSSVSFAPGSSLLAPSEAKKLDTLATALNQRPGLKVELSGYIDKARDPEGYRAELLLQKMRQEKYLELAKNRQTKDGDDADKMIIQPAEYARYLKAVYLKEKFPKPRNLIGMVKDLPDTEMKKLIIANTVAGEQELLQLAAKRAATVRQYLINQGKLDSQRLFQKQDAITKPPKQENSPASRVELNPIAS